MVKIVIVDSVAMLAENISIAIPNNLLNIYTYIYTYISSRSGRSSIIGSHPYVTFKTI